MVTPNTENPILETALFLISEGFSVIPVRRSKNPAEDKRPATEVLPGHGWREFQTRIATEQEVHQWFDKPKYNLAIVCGRVSGNLVVPDFDTDEACRRWAQPHQTLLAGIPVEKTGREGGGWHLYLRTKTTVGCGVKGDHFDLKGEGGYVVCAPSVHGVTGKRYTVVRGDMAKIPAFEAETLNLDALGGNGSSLKPKGWEIPLLEDVSEHQRNIKLTALVGRWVAKRLGRDEVLRLALATNGGWRKPLGKDEVVRTVDSVIQTDARKNPEKVRTGDVPAPGVRKIHWLSVKDIMQFHPVEYVIDPYLPKGALVNLSAYTGSGKTVITTAMCVAVMTGLPFMGTYKVNQRGLVMYLDQENPQSYVKDRITKMRFQESDSFMFAHFEGLKLDNDKDFAAIKEDIEKFSPVLVVFDTLLRFHNQDENSATEMGLVMGRLRELANMGPTVLTQIHMNKSGDLRTRSRGSTDIIGGCDLELSISEDDPKKNPGLLTLQSVKARMAPISPITLRIQETNGELMVVLADKVSSEVADAVDEILQETDAPLSVTAILGKLKDQGVEPHRNTVYSHLKRRVEANDESLIVTKIGTTGYYRARGEAF